MKTEWVGGIGHCLIPEDEADVATLKLGLHIPEHPYLKGVYSIGDRYVWLMTMSNYVEMRGELQTLACRRGAITPEQAIAAEEGFVRMRTGIYAGRIEVVVSNFAVQTFEEAETVRKAIRKVNEAPMFVLDTLTGRLTCVWSSEVNDG